MQPHYGPQGWKTVRFAIRGWGTTLRLIVILLALPLSLSVGSATWWLLTR